MQKALILTASNPAKNPRPARMIENLRGHYELYAMGIGTTPIEGVRTFSFSAYTKRNFFQECKLYLNVLLSRWDALIWTQNRLEIVPFLQKHYFDFILCFDLPLLPIVLKYKKKAKVIFDAQEFFPLWLTSSLRWNLLFKRFNHYLCQTFLPQAHCVLSVSPSFVERYTREYGICPRLYLSLPYFYDCPPKPCNPKEIKILYHGSLSSNRKIEGVVELSDGLQERFSLDLILVGGEKRYRQKIERMVEARRKRGQKIRILPPVEFENIIPFGWQYDIGLYLMPPSTYNLLCTIPNKFFEYIGSSLALVSTPNTDLVAFFESYGLGEVSRDFSARSVREVLHSLSESQINAYKHASYEASKTLNNTHNKAKILEILKSL